jgi:hypothetical protein
MKVWLDDIRDPVHYGHIGWHWVKTVEDFIAAMKTGKVEDASLDHDLSVNATIGQPCSEKTGYDAVCWMEANNVWPKSKPTVHSMNPVGRKRMQQAIDQYYSRTSR